MAGATATAPTTVASFDPERIIDDYQQTIHREALPEYRRCLREAVQARRAEKADRVKFKAALDANDPKALKTLERLNAGESGPPFDKHRRFWKSWLGKMPDLCAAVGIPGKPFTDLDEMAEDEDLTEGIESYDRDHRQHNDKRAREIPGETAKLGEVYKQTMEKILELDREERNIRMERRVAGEKFERREHIRRQNPRCFDPPPAPPAPEPVTVKRAPVAETVKPKPIGDRPSRVVLHEVPIEGEHRPAAPKTKPTPSVGGPQPPILDDLPAPRPDRQEDYNPLA